MFPYKYNERNLETKFGKNGNNTIIYPKNNNKKNNKIKLFLNIRILACQKSDKIQKI